jgi:hypothetical protein
MFGKPEWFTRRKYLGWGIMPKTWQGWAYIAVFLAPVVVEKYVLHLSASAEQTFLLVWIVIFLADVFDIMMHLKHDERDRIHEAFAERNALWAVMLSLVVGILYRASVAVFIPSVTQPVDPVIIVALFAGLAAKGATNIYLDRKD